MKNNESVCRLTNGFLKDYQELVRDVSIPYQWEILNDQIPEAEKSGAIQNIKLAAGLASGEYYGTCFQDSDIGKWLEAVSYSLETEPDPHLEALADSIISLLAQAQREDGYLNSYFTVKEPGKRFTNLRECCEHYCFGHLAEAAAAWYEVTGKDNLLKIACRYADLLCEVFGPKEGQSRGYDGHPEAELALVRLFEVTGEKRYLQLADFFLTVRGEEPYYMDWEWEQRGRTWHDIRNKDLKPGDDRTYDCAKIQPRFQKKAEGHAVKVGYLVTGMAAVAFHTGDAGLETACRSIYQNIIDQRMYITGGIGSTRHQERFTFDYDLPNDRAYAETCAAVSMAFFARRMISLCGKPDRTFADTLERVLYNGALSGMSLDGTHFFYLNPLEILPEACVHDKDFKYVKPIRPKWYQCACCPPNLIRLVSSIHRYIYSVHEDTIYVHLYASSRFEANLKGGSICILQETDYPWDGVIRLKLSGFAGGWQLGLRIPGWCGKWELTDYHGQPPAGAVLQNGYLVFKPCGGFSFTLRLTMAPVCVTASCLVKADTGKAALMRGPVVYCMEEVDNQPHLYDIIVSPEGGFTEYPSRLFSAGELPSLPGEGKSIYENAVFLEADTAWLEEALPGRPLYIPYGETVRKPVRVRFVPYFLWGNRNGSTPREMQVWFRVPFH